MIKRTLRTLGIALLAIPLFATLGSAADTIKVGVLHSLSGTMAISETTLKDTVLMLIDEQKDTQNSRKKKGKWKGGKGFSKSSRSSLKKQ